MNERSNRLAHCLSSLGAQKNKFVAIHMNRSPEMIIAVLGVLKAGNVYVPLDINSPHERNKKVLLSIKPYCILTNNEQLLKNLDMYRQYHSLNYIFNFDKSIPYIIYQNHIMVFVQLFIILNTLQIVYSKVVRNQQHINLVNREFRLIFVKQTDFLSR